MSQPNENSDSVSRREFVAGAALTTAGVAAGLSYYFSRPKPPDLTAKEGDPVKMGFIGVGNRGSSLLRTALQVPGAVPIAICDKKPGACQDRKKDVVNRAVARLLKDESPPHDKARAKELEAKEAARVQLYDDYRYLLDDKEVEAVVIATPHYLHGQMALDAIEAKKHVYCEKALAFTIGENQDICDLIRGNPRTAKGEKLVFQVGHQRRYSPLYRRVVDMIRTDHIGDVTTIRAQWNRNDEIRRPCPNLDLERIINWRLYQEYSGGLTTEFATHQIDVVNWMLGTHPESVCGYGGVDWYKDGRDTHDNIHLIFNYRVPTPKRDSYGRVEKDANGNPVHAKDSEGNPLFQNVCFDYMSIMTNDHLRFSELILGRYGTIAVTLGGGEFFKEKKAREDPDRIAEGTNPRRSSQKKILRSGATVVASSGIGYTPGDPIELGQYELEPDHWTNFIEPIQGAYDRVETLLAVESFVDCVRLSRQAGKNPEPSFETKLQANAEIGMWAAVPALMANIAMREQRTVRWSEFFTEPT